MCDVAHGTNKLIAIAPCCMGLAMRLINLIYGGFCGVAANVVLASNRERLNSVKKKLQILNLLACGRHIGEVQRLWKLFKYTASKEQFRKKFNALKWENVKNWKLEATRCMSHLASVANAWIVLWPLGRADITMVMATKVVYGHTAYSRVRKCWIVCNKQQADICTLSRHILNITTTFCM